MATVTFQGSPVSTNGSLPALGSKAPDFKLVDKDLNDVGLEKFAGKKKLLNIVPSLDTPTCAISTKKFNDYAKQNAGVAICTISADLPFAQGRFCGAEGIENVATLSMMRTRDFARDYGVLIEDTVLAGITARAVVVLDENDKVIYTQLVPEIADEPDYETALKAL
uniref:Thiol peroxidase n=2 Tax=unclassified Candidatus Kentrum TaxID=2643149 RepID=A0A451A9I0_9GAMM|nr:MAG: thiol peroxidase, atypical 2-Cys peroxiredoxin [Candidatus Kentron sp. LPFa]VFK10153.1 MAG: thiol peroxidase, atypical 2-Cys peroxiredoxin [Candidatus Kentron sp. LPFa]VFK26182.1 MAG: thiol peroxidase, atypical 2-Cys peroxiredoxin [Candidatus Kentron sp. LPFa]VFK62682.1 MAG: thiol peroxidase, atypical 2-Cys peroxiredoxin [Candidatus Kentron sp. UNK]VFK70570.1 MAG: thiol peroxidase, atypical 2-Cys peroxiredoxin [Candidatus Kentron sp. UNK]